MSYILSEELESNFWPHTYRDTDDELRSRDPRMHIVYENQNLFPFNNDFTLTIRTINIAKKQKIGTLGYVCPRSNPWTLKFCNNSPSFLTRQYSHVCLPLYNQKIICLCSFLNRMNRLLIAPFEWKYNNLPSMNRCGLHSKRWYLGGPSISILIN